MTARLWEWHLATHPLTATALGDRRFDDRLPDITPGGRARQDAERAAFAREVAAIAPDGLGPGDRLTLAMLRADLENREATRACDLESFTVEPRDGPQVTFLNLAALQTVHTAPEGQALVARWQKMGPYVDAWIESLRRGLAAGRVAPRGGVEKVIAQLDAILADPDDRWVLASPAAAAHADWPPADAARFRDGVRGAVASGIRPAFARYRDFLRAEVLPRARDDEHVGLGALPGGVDCYRRLIKVETSLDVSPEEAHAFGLAEIARIRGEMSELGGKLFGTSDLAAIQRRMRGADRSLFFTSRDEVEAKAAEALRRAEAAVPRWFGRTPRTPCVVKRIPAYEEKDTTIAYYRQPAADGSRPGVYWINTYAPETRPRFEAEVLAFHESVPGHHLQIAIAQEIADLPAFRRHAEVNAFVEGWALYTERLAAEMGLYSGDLDRLGMLSFDAWRASRLVVDTGIHAMGWSRQRAEAYMLENTLLAPNNIANEVDRYISTPAQALGYKLGQREILRLRAEAERHLGARFDLRAFHDVVLGQGAITLEALRAVVGDWIAARS